jgi:hypothetical protein
MPGTVRGPYKNRQVTFVMAATDCALELYRLQKFMVTADTTIGIWFYETGDWDTENGNPYLYLEPDTTSYKGWRRVGKCDLPTRHASSMPTRCVRCFTMAHTMASAGSHVLLTPTPTPTPPPHRSPLTSPPNLLPPVAIPLPGVPRHSHQLNVW